jgi:tellurite methyltransferase
MNHSIAFFDRQFSQGATPDALVLNPFEQRALPHLQGEVLDFGCGMGNLAFAAAARGCRVTALDASAAAIAHIQQRAAREAVPVQAAQADLRAYEINADYDAVVSIGLLMFFDCATARRVLAELLRHVRPGGVAAVNVLVEGTTYMAMFEPQAHCLLPADELPQRFAGWELLHHELSTFEAPGQTVKRFCTVVARKPR